MLYYACRKTMAIKVMLSLFSDSGAVPDASTNGGDSGLTDAKRHDVRSALFRRHRAKLKSANDNQVALAA